MATGAFFNGTVEVTTAHGGTNGATTFTYAGLHQGNVVIQLVTTGCEVMERGMRNIYISVFGFFKVLRGEPWLDQKKEPDLAVQTLTPIVRAQPRIGARARSPHHGLYLRNLRWA